ncbi:response regulator [Hyunsoonleella sp. SJ7]|uniref:histidine kinase n=1 Tax=Hyunsoonleella aquatilis TaxID=2762758 RepID=A0A923KJF9_9FLAO|nr:response regulator [Hyunsoonleella aquatilis]MBC3757327.1 response regulator [Hyunsoonleella aquatilis]
MKTSLLFCFLFFSVFSFGNEDREVIKRIDALNTSAKKSFDNNDILESFKQFLDAKALSDSISDNYGSATADFNLGNIYSLMGDHESAEAHYHSTLKMLHKIDDAYLVSNAYFNLAKIYKGKRYFNQSINYFEKAIKFAIQGDGQSETEKHNIQRVIFEARANLCEIYIDNNDFERALLGFSKMNSYLKENEIDNASKAYFNYVYAKYYAENEMYNNANSKFREAAFLLESRDEESSLELLSKIYFQLSISLAKSDHSTQAYLALLEHNKYRDSFLDTGKGKRDLITKSKFLIEDYKNNAEKANAERLYQLEIANKFRKINIAIVVTLLLLIISMIIIYRSYVSKRKLNDSLKLKNSELEQAKDAALKTSELKSKFISNVSHELRTPLYGVVGLSSLLLDNNDLNPEDRKHLKSLKYSGDYLLNLINDILQVSKMEHNKIELTSVSVNLSELLNNMVGSFNYRLEETNNKIEIAIDNYVPQYIMCDKVRLSQILINLIGNSIKFTSNGIINLNVKLLSLDPNKVGLRFEVKDNGIGIPKEKFDTIFDNFAQLEDSNLNYQGTGLGLSITKSLIELFNSEIKLESQVGVGTKISFEVDFELDITKDNSVATFNSRASKISAQKNRYKILVAEDNKINQVVTKNLLEKQNYACTLVGNGKEALEEVKKNQYDLILMDINMPIMNGNEATQAIRRFNRVLPIIALTASDIDEIKHQYKNVGFNDIIIKPFDNYEFYQVISQNIQNRTKGDGENGGDISLVIAS